MREDYLSVKNSNCLKGIFALFIIIHHVRAHINILNDTVPGMILTALGYLSVSVFFFISGFGISISRKNKPEYIKTFPKNRILSFYCIYLFSALIYLIFDCAQGNYPSVRLTITTLTYAGTWITNGWFMQVILIFYIVFYLSFRFIKNPKIAIATITLFAVVFCMLNEFYYTSLVYECIFSFVLGIIWAEYKTKIDEFLRNKKYWLTSLFASFVVFAVTVLFGNLEILPMYLRMPVKMLSGVAFSIFVITLITRLPVNNIVTRFLGKINLELYIIHGMMITIFYYLIPINNDYISALLVFVSSFAAALLLKPIYDFINKAVKNLGTKRERKETENN